MDETTKWFDAAIILLWAGVVFGVLNLAGHAFLIWQATGDLSGAGPLLLTAAVFVFVQARLMFRLGTRNPRVRDRLAFITLIRTVLTGLSLPALLTTAPWLVLPPVAGAVMQISGLALLYLPPANQAFARRA
jgi:hypothetical protein